MKNLKKASVLLSLFFSLAASAKPAEQWICQNHGFNMPALVVVNSGDQSEIVIKDKQVCARLGVICPFTSGATESDRRPDFWPVISSPILGHQNTYVGRYDEYHIRLRTEPSTGGMVLERWARVYRSYMALRGTDWYFHYGECQKY